MNFVQTAVMFFRDLLTREGGQDLVEYSLVFAMIALGSVTGMGYLASGINDVFSTVGSTLTTATA
jgi:pilus assembly protein Flp/PilA